MQPWPKPDFPELPEHSALPIRVFDSKTQSLPEVAPSPTATIYTCGITPYDATHIGHANTYVAFDLLNRIWRDAGKQIVFSQNITDVDDPLLERAYKTGVEWQDLAASQIDLFRGDMAALRVMPPDYWITVSEAMPEIIATVTSLLRSGSAYFIHHYPDADEFMDVYFDITKDPNLGCVAHLPYDEALELFAARGGDPERPGKRNKLDPLLWRAERFGEPWWDGGVLGRGRPGWHIGCTVIARDTLGDVFDVTGGGSDLLFPHHEMSSSLARVLTDNPEAGANYFIHCGMISYQGEKMSKSLGNLVIVSDLIKAGVDPMAIRLALLSHHYRTDWEWTDQELKSAQQRLEIYRVLLLGSQEKNSRHPAAQSVEEPQSGVSKPRGAQDLLSAQIDPSDAEDQVVLEIRKALSDDLNAPKALAAIDNYIANNGKPSQIITNALNTLLGIKL